MAVFMRTDPHVRPGWRNHQRADTIERAWTLDASASGVTIQEAATATDAGDAGLAVVDVSKSRRPGGCDVAGRVSRDRHTSHIARPMPALETKLCLVLLQEQVQGARFLVPGPGSGSGFNVLTRTTRARNQAPGTYPDF
jgi:hypothetical protein